jgi:hypothetical protein
VPNWDTAININGKFLQGLLNLMAEEGVFCLSGANEYGGFQVSASVEEAAYPELVLTIMPYAVPLTADTSFTAGTISFRQAGSYGITLAIETSTGFADTVSLDLQADCILEISGGLLGFRLGNISASNISMPGVDAMGDLILYQAVTAAIEDLIARLDLGTEALGLDGVALPFRDNCVAPVGYGSWAYCDDLSERALSILIDFDATDCPALTP